jgi:pyridoxine 5-phosphate synthase
MPSLTVMVDYVAALRHSMQCSTPDPVAAAMLAELAGADGIGVYLREDRGYLSDRDVRLLRQTLNTRLVLLMAAFPEMVGTALEIKPERVVLMPEIRKETPIETGMDLSTQGKALYEIVDTLQSNSISVGLCIQADPHQAKLAHQLRADWVMIHAGRLRAATSPQTQRQELNRIVDTVKMAHKLRLHIAVGRGLDHRLIKLFQGVAEIDEFSLGRDILARALFVGLDRAVREMITLLRTSM